MRRELLIAAGPGEWRAAWLEDGSAVELHIERGDIRPASSVQLGRVVRLAAGLDAAFVDIGEERLGFLPLRQKVEEGARVIVQVRREAQLGKGARLSLRFDDAAAAALAAQASQVEPPAQLAPVAAFATALALRLPARPDRVVTDDAVPLRELRAAFPDSEIAQVAAGDWPLDLDAAFEAALSPTLALAGGGRIYIEEGRAAVLIDVDTGTPETGSFARTTMATNLAAAAAIARQLRLRQIGGAIIIDFAGVEGRRSRERAQQAMTAALASDPAKPEVLGWSRLGQLEIVRPRRFRSLAAAMLEPQGSRKSAAALAFAALRTLQREARARPAANWRLVVTPEIAAVLRAAAAGALHALEGRLGRTFAIEIARNRDVAPFDIAAAHDDIGAHGTS